MDGREQITTVGDGLLVLAPAKINLSLLIAGKRRDGFHEIETIMAKIDWYDEIHIQHGRQPHSHAVWYWMSPWICEELHLKAAYRAIASLCSEDSQTGIAEKASYFY